jgi:hypothetical protein
MNPLGFEEYKKISPHAGMDELDGSGSTASTNNEEKHP